MSRIPPTPPPIPESWATAPKAPKGPRESFLAWWAIAPVIVFILVEIIFGLSVAKVEASEPEYAISYLMGRIMGGLLFSSLIGWIVFRLSSRSQRAGTIGFSFLLMLVCVSEFSKWARSRNANQQNRPFSEQSLARGESPTRRFPVFGVAVAEPAGWIELIPADLNEFGRWISPDSKSENPKGVILLRGERPKSGVAADLAKQLARDWGGRITNDRDEVAGERAWRIESQPEALEARPVEALVTMHDGYVYVLMGAAMRGTSCHDQIETIRRSWKWMALEPASRHMEFRRHPVEILDGALTINFPAVMTTFKPPRLDRAQGLSLYNLRRGELDFDVIFQLFELAGDNTLDTAKERLTMGLEEKFKLTEKFVWHQIKGQARGSITQVVQVPSPDRAHWMMWAIVGLDARRALLVNFTFATTDADDRAVYANVGEKIVESIQQRK